MPDLRTRRERRESYNRKRAFLWKMLIRCIIRYGVDAEITRIHHGMYASTVTENPYRDRLDTGAVSRYSVRYDV